MDYRRFEEIYKKCADNAKVYNSEISTAYRLYAYELFTDEQGFDGDIEHIKDMVEATSHELEALYQLQNDNGSVGEGDYETVITKASVFAALLCIASRIYENLDPVFSRDLIHASLEAAHYLMVGQFKTGEEADEGQNERVSVMRMNSRDDELSEAALAAQFWAFSELLRTDEDVRNAYDHSLMAGMPQKMSRQKRYRIRLSDLFRKVFNTDNFDELKVFFESGKTQPLTDYVLFSAIAILLDEKENASEEIRKNVEQLIMDYDEVTPKSYLVLALLSNLLTLKKDANIKNDGSQLIKVIEYNVINDNRKKLSEEEKARINDRITELEEMIKSL
ncbi:MAG: hypothetical protein E7302_13785 [Butyrivibrio sp.]|nr:hypothetical protein [Butyrivibrio sp.]